MKKNISTAFLFVILFFTATKVNAQFLITSSGSYAQNFDALVNTGNATWTDNTTIPNWYSQRTGTGTTYTAGTGSSNAGGLYSFGTSGSADRALGTVGSNNAAAGGFAHGVQFQNTSGGNVTNIQVGYTLEQWRNSGTNVVNQLYCYYKKGTTRIDLLNPPDTFNIPPVDINAINGWTQITGLTLIAPISTGTSGALDGNAAANRVSVSGFTIPGLTLANNEFLMIKWDDSNHVTSDHGLGIDDVNISWTVGSSNTPNLSASSITGFGNVCLNSTAGPNTFTISGSNLTTADITVGPLAGYSFSTSSGGTYSSTLTITQPGGTLLPYTVYVQFTPTAAQSYNGNIPVTGAGSVNNINVAVTGSGSSILTPAFTPIDPICSGSTLTLPGISTNGVTGSWSPAINNNTTTTYTFTPGTNQCAVPTNLTVTVIPSVTPQFNQLDPVCLGENFTLPSTSLNGVNGSWYPPINNTATTTYTFVPVSGQCANSVTMTVEVNTSNAQVVTGDSTAITANSAVLSGTVSGSPCEPVTEYGIEYSGVNGFTIGTKVPSVNIASGNFSCSLSGLVQNTVYFYKAYAKSGSTITYGEQKLFVTLPIPTGLTVYGSPIIRGSNVHYTLSGIKPGHYAVRIFNVAGQLVYQKDMILQVNFIDDNLIMPAKLPVGLYTFQVFNPTFKIQQTIMVQ